MATKRRPASRRTRSRRPRARRIRVKHLIHAVEQIELLARMVRRSLASRKPDELISTVPGGGGKRPAYVPTSSKRLAAPC